MSTETKGFWPLIKIIPIKTNFRLMRFAKPFAIVSLILCIASLVITVYPLKPPCGGLNCGVDFKGGTLMEISTGKAIDQKRLVDVIQSHDVNDVLVQGIGQPNATGGFTSANIRFMTPESANPAQKVTEIQNALTRELGPTKFTRTEVVGPSISGELFGKGLLALALGIGMMMTYIWFRFGRSFGVGAAVALLHDVILTFGLFALTDMEFTLTAVAAILTIIGYSVNDTIVVLDRIRENLRKYKKMPMQELLDLSINETFSRTIMTGVTGLMALTVLAVFGGEALFGFSVAMIFGIVVGTFSSFFLAAPMLMWLGVVRGDEEAEVQVLGPASRA
ncbi:MAG: protein translocase subunit SecF [Caulobacteraceae bacterium]|nr:protein translocase subunit SecF [Caulobacter sp.]RYF92237.1 MAG: protein translocase subunit SecF [Caulobacteraceae bacterium]